MAAWFTEPEAATSSIAGVRVARVLLDREATFAAIQAQAIHFTWSEEMQQKANHWASEMMVGLIEETHKGLEGLRRHDGSAETPSQSVGRLLNARFGLSWLLSNVIRVQRGVLISGDNTFYAETAAAIGTASEWVRLRRIAFGLEDAQGRAPTLRQQVEAGLHLYVETARLLAGTLRPNDEPLIHQTVERIQRTLAAQSQSLANENRRNV